MKNQGLIHVEHTSYIQFCDKCKQSYITNMWMNLFLFSAIQYGIRTRIELFVNQKINVKILNMKKIMWLITNI